MIVSTAPFFAPAYFSPYFFPPLAADSTATGSDVSPFRDSDVLSWVAAALRSTGEFADVSFGTTPQRSAAGADRLPIAVVTPEGWVEADDTDPVVLVREVGFTVTIVVRDEEPSLRYQALDRLACVVQNVIDGSDLGGMVLSPLTRLRRGRPDPDSTPPEQGVVLSGEFTYLVPSAAGHDTN
jgi:hypothetical protein